MLNGMYIYISEPLRGILFGPPICIGLSFESCLFGIFGDAIPPSSQHDRFLSMLAQLCFGYLYS